MLLTQPIDSLDEQQMQVSHSLHQQAATSGSVHPTTPEWKHGYKHGCKHGI